MKPLRVFKFGGASVKDADAVRNVAEILKSYADEDIFVVISAMGKMTNALERLVKAYHQKDPNWRMVYNEIRTFHQQIILDLLENPVENTYEEIDNLFLELECLLETPVESDFDYTYDQIVPFGELMSTRIVSAYLNKHEIRNRWMDCRNFITTDQRYREAKVDWELTNGLIERKLLPMARKQMIITQGFIGRAHDLSTTTLGRDGSDYSAAIFASCLGAEDLVIWKDVPGVMNADPKKDSSATSVPHISYRETVELAYYGASVIHPKTIQPLQSKGIPLKVKNFTNPNQKGTLIDVNGPLALEHHFYISKENQCLITLRSRDFSFITEEPLSMIFQAFSQCRMHINLMHNSAISFSICTDMDPNKQDQLFSILEQYFEFTQTAPVTLYTIRHSGANGNIKIPEKDRILLRNATENMEQFVLK